MKIEQSVHALHQSNHNAPPLIFRQFTESDYDYSDSEEDAAMEMQRKEQMASNGQRADKIKVDDSNLVEEKENVIADERGGAVAESLPGSKVEDDDDNKLCIVCMDGAREYGIVPCGHLLWTVTSL